MQHVDSLVSCGYVLCPLPTSRCSYNTCKLVRYLKHVHVGPYQILPAKWAALRTELAESGETIGSPAMEIYGHHCDDPSELETTILIGLK